MDHSIFDSAQIQFRYREASDKASGAIDVHIIRPGWGSSGYYSESVLQAACQNRVYPAGMHMHLDHPSNTEENDQPARTLKTLIGALTESGHYETAGWDGPGVYALAKILPQYRDQIKEMEDFIGISHYVDGRSEDGTAPDGKRGRIIKELVASPLNTVDFVTVPGAGGKFRALFESMTRWTGSAHNEAPNIQRAREVYRDELVNIGMPVDQANRIADMSAPERDTDLARAREEYRDSLIAIGKTPAEAERIAGIR
jgi:hypothetical protein